MTDQWAPAALVALLVGGLVAVVGDVLGFAAVVCGSVSLVARSIATLKGGSKKDVDRATAAGVFIGIGLTLVAYAIDALT